MIFTKELSKNCKKTTFLGLLFVILFIPIIDNPSLGSNYLPAYDNAATNTKDRVFQNGSFIFGKSYEEWTKEWWKWAISIPLNMNPAYDDAGKNCHIDQKPPVWFFPGTFNHPANRICLIPENVAILFPILNSECSFIEFPKLNSSKELSDCAKKIQDHVTLLNATLDYENIPNLNKMRIHTDIFNFSYPHNNILGIKNNGTSKAVSDGNWVFIKPLSIGIHHLTFLGGVNNTNPGIIGNRFTNDSFAFPSGWNYQANYKLIVLPNSLNDKLYENINNTKKDLENFHNSFIESLLQNVFDNHINQYLPINQTFFNEIIKHSNGWNLIKNDTTGEQSIKKEFNFNSFPQSIGFTYYVSLISQILDHHPNIEINWKTVNLKLNTWSINNTISNMDIEEMILFDQLYDELYH